MVQMSHHLPQLFLEMIQEVPYRILLPHLMKHTALHKYIDRLYISMIMLVTRD